MLRSAFAVLFRRSTHLMKRAHLCALLSSSGGLLRLKEAEPLQDLKRRFVQTGQT